MLSTPQYQIRKDKKSGLLVSPSKVTVVGPVDSSDEFAMPKDDAHAQVMAGSGPSPVPFAQQSTDFVSQQDFEVLNNQLEEKFERFEALLTRTNIFSTSKLPVNVENPPVSDTPFINPSLDPRATCPVRPPGQDTESGTDRKDKGLGKSNTRRNLIRLLLPVRQARVQLMTCRLSRLMYPVRVVNLLISQVFQLQ